MKKNICGAITILFLFCCSDTLHAAECDINGDGKTGLEEAIYALQVVAGNDPDSCRSNDGCYNGFYCAKVEGECLSTGRCAEVPQGCPDVWDPVCGCDGRTYGNSCEAAVAGVNVGSQGECRDTSCDDGSDALCMRVQQECKSHEILAIQNSCWVCVNPATCREWGEPGCVVDGDCPGGYYCNLCGSSSCPVCDDCIAACEEIVR